MVSEMLQRTEHDVKEYRCTGTPHNAFCPYCLMTVWKRIFRRLPRQVGEETVGFLYKMDPPATTPPPHAAASSSFRAAPRGRVRR